MAAVVVAVEMAVLEAEVVALELTVLTTVLLTVLVAVVVADVASEVTAVLEPLVVAEVVAEVVAVVKPHDSESELVGLKVLSWRYLSISMLRSAAVPWQLLKLTTVANPEWSHVREPYSVMFLAASNSDT